MAADLRSLDSSGTTAVVDTNVLLDAYSNHDLLDAFTSTAQEGDQDAQVSFRKRRAKDSLVLALYLDQQKATTWCLGAEARNILRPRAHPDPSGDARRHHVILFRTFVKDRLIPSWNAVLVDSHDDDALKGNACDRRLVELARLHRLPLITNEGLTAEGIIDETKTIRVYARKAQVRITSPREFWEGKLDEAETIGTFLQNFKDKTPAYAAEQVKPDRVRESLDHVYDYLEYVFAGA